MKTLLPLAAFALLACSGGEAPTPDDPLGSADRPDALGDTGSAPWGDPSSDPLPETGTPQPFHGLWALSDTDCSLPAGSTPAAPVEFTPQRFTSFDTQCVIRKTVTIVGQAEFDALLDCDDTAANQARGYYLKLRGNTLMMQGDDGSVTWTRCPAQQE